MILSSVLNLIFFQYDSLYVPLSQKCEQMEEDGKEKFPLIFIQESDLKDSAKLLPKFQWKKVILKGRICPRFWSPLQRHNCQEELEEVVETSQKVVETEDGFEDALFSNCHE